MTGFRHEDDPPAPEVPLTPIAANRATKWSLAVSTSIFRGVSEADCLRQAEADAVEARAHSYEPMSQTWSDEAGLKVLTITYRFVRPVRTFDPLPAAPVATSGDDRPAWQRVAYLVSGLVLLYLVASGLGIFGRGHAIAGTFTLTQDEPVSTSGGCSGTGGYSDFRAGMNVTVKNESGTVLGTTTTAYKSGSGKVCVLSFSLTGIGDAKFYSIEAGRRGALTYSQDEMAARDWHVDLTLGS